MMMIEKELINFENQLVDAGALKHLQRGRLINLNENFRCFTRYQMSAFNSQQDVWTYT